MARKISKIDAIAKHSRYLKIEPENLIKQYREINQTFKIVKFLPFGFTFKCNIVTAGINFGTFYIDFNYIDINHGNRMGVRGGILLSNRYRGKHLHIYKIYGSDIMTLCTGSTIQLYIKTSVFYNKNIVSAVFLIVDFLSNAKANDGLTTHSFNIRRCEYCDDVLATKNKSNSCDLCRKKLC